MYFLHDVHDKDRVSIYNCGLLCEEGILIASCFSTLSYFFLLECSNIPFIHLSILLIVYFSENFQLEKALNEMHAEAAEIKLEYQKKMSKAHVLEATVEEKYFELKSKIHSLDAKLAEVSRRSSELERRSEDVETRQLKLAIESSSFMIEYTFPVQRF